MNYPQRIYSDDTLDLEGELISVIIPARNEEKYIKKCIQSLLDQNIKNYELLLVDDNSTDSTFDLMENFRIRPKSKNIQSR